MSEQHKSSFWWLNRPILNPLLVVLALLLACICGFIIFVFTVRFVQSIRTSGETQAQVLAPTIKDKTITSVAPWDSCLGEADDSFRHRSFQVCLMVAGIAQQDGTSCNSKINETMESLLQWVSDVKAMSLTIDTKESKSIYEMSTDAINQRSADINNCYIRYQ